MVNMGETLPASGQAGTCARQGIDRLQVGDTIIMDGVSHIVTSVSDDMTEIDRKHGRDPAPPLERMLAIDAFVLKMLEEGHSCFDDGYEGDCFACEKWINLDLPDPAGGE